MIEYTCKEKERIKIKSREKKKGMTDMKYEYILAKNIRSCDECPLCSNYCSSLLKCGKVRSYTDLPCENWKPDEKIHKGMYDFPDK